MGITQFLVGITVAKKLKLMQSAAFRLYRLFITKLHIITTFIFGELIPWSMCSILEQPCRPVWKLGKFLGSFMKAKLVVRFFALLLSQTFLNSCCQPCYLCSPKCSSKAATTLRCSWRTNLEVPWALARGSGSRVAERGWNPCSSVPLQCLKHCSIYSLLILIQICECPIQKLIGTDRWAHGHIWGAWDIIYISQRVPASCCW